MVYQVSCEYSAKYRFKRAGDVSQINRSPVAGFIEDRMVKRLVDSREFNKRLELRIINSADKYHILLEMDGLLGQQYVG
jgi:hypothetical protein